MFSFGKIAWHYLCQEGRKTRIFVHTICFGKKCFGPKQCKPGSTIKIVVSAEIAPNQKWHLFLKKVLFDMGEKRGFTNRVFEKLCFFFWKHYFIVFPEKHSSCNTNTVCKQKTENWWQIVGCFWTWQKGVFLLVSFFRLECHCDFLSGKVARVLKVLVFFPSFLGFVGWLLLVYLGLEGLGVFVFLVFAFLFGVGCVSLCLLCFVLCGWMLLFLFLFLFFLCCFVLFFCLFGVFKGQVRWPKGPPHLALNPPFIIIIILFFSCFPFFVLNRKTLFLPLTRQFLFIYLCFPLFLFRLFWPPPFFPFSFFVYLLLFSFFLPFCFSFLFLVLAFSFCFVCFLVQDVILFFFFCLLSCFESSRLISFCFPSCFLLVFFCFCCFGIL